jgi:signal transduction histidine kinase/ActR/RegA family two-component response regulator
MDIAKLDNLLKTESTKLLLSTLPFSAAANVLLAIIITTVQAEVIAAEVLYGWLVLSITLHMGVLLLWRSGGLNKAENIGRYRIINIANGLVWGLGGVMMYPAGDVFHQMFLLFALAGLIAGAAMVLMTDRISAFSFLVLAALPTMACLALDGGKIQLTLLGMSMFYLSFVMLSVHSNNRSFQENGRLRVEAVEREMALQRSGAELRKAKEQAEIAKEQAEMANRAKSSFLSSMSHELRTPLNSIIGLAEMFDRGMLGNLQQEQREPVGHILSGGRHLLTLVNEVLDLARIEAGETKLEITTLDINPLIADVVTLTRPLAFKRGISIHHNCHDKTYIKADSARLRQVLLNLLTNAVKYNIDGGSIFITLQPAKSGVRISVTDTGRGILENQHSQLFQPYQRLGAEQTAIEGTGLGLFITKHLVEAMGGSIGFKSEAGVGSSFWIELPSTGFASSTDAVSVLTDLQHATNHRASVWGRVLYVEDNLSNQSLMRHIIKQLPNVELLISECAEAGLAIIREAQPDLVLMDINLPGMSGLEALIAIRSDPNTSTIPVIAISAIAMPNDVAAGLHAGFLAYFTKPLDVTGLLSKIRESLVSKELK